MSQNEHFPLTHCPINRAMEWTGLSKFRFYQLVNEGKLRIVKVGRKSFVSVDELNALFEEHPESISQ